MFSEFGSCNYKNKYLFTPNFKGVYGTESLARSHKKTSLFLSSTVPLNNLQCEVPPLPQGENSGSGMTSANLQVEKESYGYSRL